MKITRFNRMMLIVWGSVVVSLSGCNVDGVYRDRQVRTTPAIKIPNLLASPKDHEAVDIQIADAREVDLVEDMAAHRAKYHEGLAKLREYYEVHGHAEKAKWAAYEIDGLRSVKAFRFLMDAEIPSDQLRADTSIPEADALLAKGQDLMKRGGHGVPGLYRQDLMVQAAGVFRELIETYPSSDKIDDAAFYCGEIHKEYLPDQETLAVKWYERAWAWNPDTEHPARFQAAVVYDYRLHDRDRALELYQAVIAKESAFDSNVRFAVRRIDEITKKHRTVSATR